MFSRIGEKAVSKKHTLRTITAALLISSSIVSSSSQELFPIRYGLHIEAQLV